MLRKLVIVSIVCILFTMYPANAEDFFKEEVEDFFPSSSSSIFSDSKYENLLEAEKNSLTFKEWMRHLKDEAQNEGIRLEGDNSYYQEMWEDGFSVEEVLDANQ